MINSYKISRRKFIGQASCVAVGGTTFLSSMLNLKAMNAMSINNSSVASCNDYKALVCLFNSEDLDAFNSVIAVGTTSEYNMYAATRSNLTLPLNEIRAINALISRVDSLESIHLCPISRLYLIQVMWHLFRILEP